MQSNDILGAEVIDAEGEVLGRVVRQRPDWFLVEKQGIVRLAVVVRNDEVSSMEASRIQLRLAYAEMQQRGDRPSPRQAKRSFGGGS